MIRKYSFLLTAILIYFLSEGCGWFDTTPVQPDDGQEQDFRPDFPYDFDWIQPDYIFDVDAFDYVEDIGTDLPPVDNVDFIDIIEDTQDLPPSECIPESPTELQCNDGIDNDCDRYVDCYDLDCGYEGPNELSCGDGADNDCDGEIDCDDFLDCMDADECSCDEAGCFDDCTSSGSPDGVCPCGPGDCNCVLSFEDDFSAVSGWGVESHANCDFDYAGEEYTIVSKPDYHICATPVPGGTNYWDFTVKVDCRIPSAAAEHSCGLFLRYNSGSFYIFHVRGDGYYRFEIYRGSWTTLIDWTHSPALVTDGSANHIKVTAIGPVFRFCANGEFLTYFSDTTFLSGLIYLFAGKTTGSEDAQAFFDNVKIFEE